MIYPTARAIALAALGAPTALLAGLIAPDGWAVGGAWLVLLLGLILLDALIGPSPAAASLTLDAPSVVGVGAGGTLVIRARFEGAAPAAAEVAVETNARLAAEPGQAAMSFTGSEGVSRVGLTPLRRGQGEITALWLRWRGGLGLVWKQLRKAPHRPIAVLPDIRGVKAQAIRLFSRDAASGLKSQLETGEGSEFHALREVDGATDPRTIDWKQSARHGKLLGKEFRVDRNHPVVFAIDAGRAMSEPIGHEERGAGAPRIDRAINAALLLAYVALKTGDRVGAYGFDAHPRGFSGLVAGAARFGRLQRHLSGLDYGDDETNYTLGLTQLGVFLERRSLVVVFTEFADSTSAELMVENLGRLMRRHVVLFVAVRDEELEAIARAEPTTAEAVARAVTAHALIRARDLVIARLARLGARIVDAPAARLGPALISAYLDLKRSDVL
ncbi:MAG: hypothetical protein JWO83_2668 [Caulobacteraceae bacterium]|nr:hypothetical protein [Caulobacteraceae bacterium]